MWTDAEAGTRWRAALRWARRPALVTTLPIEVRPFQDVAEY